MDATHYSHKKLKEARELMGKSLQQIADEIGVDRQTVWRAEAGTSVSYELLVELCSTYRIPMSSIVLDFPKAETAKV